MSSYLSDLYTQLDALRERKRKGNKMIEKLSEDDVDTRERYQKTMSELLKKEEALVEIIYPLTTEMLKKSGAKLPY